ncbi:acyl-CoA thioesterase [Pengzhenrongella frigida]|uniref:Thioesterase n=1 Tax=Pengzhenrongella frigida TaxID=1259133 RepID=A0A4Q5MXE2_9MICO|nr:acyl-CoA thioesterase [Cellulomonas sp. HLT2-17]RYV50299.1 thioesterase [Cellulomonas sp. HLT2-17]
MNRLLRLAWIVARARLDARRAGWQADSPFVPRRTALRVLPNDLDLLRHMNNGVYLSLMDLGRVDMMLRTGVHAAVSAQGWYPVVVGESIRFRRSLQLWERFEIETRVLGWDDRVVYLEQVFERRRPSGDVEVVAEAIVAARFLARTGGGVPAPDVAESFGADRVSPELPDEVSTWSRAIRLT